MSRRFPFAGQMQTKRNGRRENTSPAFFVEKGLIYQRSGQPTPPPGKAPKGSGFSAWSISVRIMEEVSGAVSGPKSAKAAQGFRQVRSS